MKERLHIRVSNPPPKPLIIFDGDCGFCRAWILRWKDTTGNRVDYAPSQEVGPRFPEIPTEAFTRAVQLIDVDGLAYEGAEAVFRALATRPRAGWLLQCYRRVPGVRIVSEFAYGVVSRHRGFFSSVTRFLYGRHLDKPTYRIAPFWFLRLLGLIYLAAFLSFWSQADGLVGRNGILPFGQYLDYAHTQIGAGAYWQLPTLCWLHPTDGFLHVLCGAGVVFSILLALGVVPTLSTASLWALYLSLTTVSRAFLSFQWDNLLLEIGFLAIFLSPLVGRSRLGRDPPPALPALWLLRWMLFRLMFSSGVVKLASHDPVWHNLTALQYHYETQPLPTWIGWYAHQLPAGFQDFSALVMFAIELVFPFFIFAPRRIRYFAGGGIVFLQVLIALTGNYAFFNLLSILLCLLLLDDSAFPLAWRERVRTAAPTTWSRGWPAWALAPVTAAVLLLSLVELGGTLRILIPWPVSVVRFVLLAEPFRSVNSYGLFAVMTTQRNEIVVEGSNDGKTWKPYEFKWKPGDLARRPRFVAPHQPRLDWQMWFAALGGYYREPWFGSFLTRLLEGSPDVLRLLEKNPFPDTPPRYIRAELYQYHFTTRAEWRQNGNWWRREYLGLYAPESRL